MASRARCVLASVLVLASAIPAAAQRVVDLGHSLAATDPSWSGSPVFQRKPEKGDGYVGGSFSSDEHFGTHLDAPAHFGGAWTVDRIPVERLVRPGVCVNVTGKPEDYQVTVADLKAFEAKNGAIPEGAIVMIATGWDARWSDPKKYMNERNGVKHFPGLSVEAGAYLAKDRKVYGIGIDTPSIDYGPSAKFETHSLTMKQNLFHIENATNLTSLPASGYTIVVAPIKIAGGSGGPTRVFALMK